MHRPIDEEIATADDLPDEPFFFPLVTSFSHWSVIGAGRLPFSMNWFSFVFPNTALITATFAIGKAFSSKATNVFGCVMVFPLVLMYIFVCLMMVRAIVRGGGGILWPQKGEDRDEGRFQRQTGSRGVEAQCD